jgi:hypothetical protein
MKAPFALACAAAVFAACKPPPRDTTPTKIDEVQTVAHEEPRPVEKPSEPAQRPHELIAPEALCEKIGKLLALVPPERLETTPHDDCVARLTAAKEASSEAYARITSCADRPGYWEASGCIEDVVDENEKVDDAFAALEKKKREEMKKALLETDEEKQLLTKLKAWPNEKPHKVKGIARSDGTEVAFTLLLPKRFELKRQKDDLDDAYYEMQNDVETDFAPSIRVSLGLGPADLEDAKNIATESNTNEAILSAEKTDSGYVLATENDFGVDVAVVVTTDDVTVECTGSLIGDDVTAAKETLVPWLIKTCRSLEVTNVTPMAPQNP